MDGLAAAGGAASLTPDVLRPAVSQAIDAWAAAGADAAQLASLRGVDVQLAQLSGQLLGMASSANIIWIDLDAAGYGWSATASASGVDLASVVAHELGHILGLNDLPYQQDVMGSHLAPGTQRTPSAHSLQPLRPWSFENSLSGASLLARDAAFAQGLRLDDIRSFASQEDQSQETAPPLVEGVSLLPGVIAEVDRRRSNLRREEAIEPWSKEDREQDDQAAVTLFASSRLPRLRPSPTPYPARGVQAPVG